MSFDVPPLKVSEAKQRDAEKRIARIDREILQQYNEENRDLIKSGHKPKSWCLVIFGKRETLANPQPHYTADQGKNMIRINRNTRISAGAKIGDYVTVRKVYLVKAERIVLTPVNIRVKINPDFISYVKTRISGRYITEGDILSLVMLDHDIQFKVTKVLPKAYVQISKSTNLEIRSEPIMDSEIPVNVNLLDSPDALN